ncbi:MAG: glycosyltransferase family 39 protein [Candidatus Levybacteria bacterium]|nr:glycosyltransferase family 39 protein [Candidatus Levybacteria bacterium]
MFNLAIIVGLYSYTIFFLGLMQILHREIVVSITIIFVTIAIFYFRQNIKIILRDSKKEWISIQKNKISLFVFTTLVALISVNLIGALGPELAFDALWYHLTLPKLYLVNHAMYHIPGGLLYYSDMPKLGELLYVGALTFGNEIWAKVLHWLFSILTLIVIYKLARKFYTQTISLLAVLIFYSSLVIAWESTTAYIDLIRTFFEVLALLAFVHWWQLEKRRWLILSAIMVGLSISSKLLALGSLGIFSLLIIWKALDSRLPTSPKLRWTSRGNDNISALMSSLFKNIFIYWGISLIIPLPWFLFAFFNTGNPFYPIFSDVFAGLHTKVFDIALLNPITFIGTLWNVFTHANDPLSPIYILFLPLLIWYFRKADIYIKILYAYFIIALGLWYITSQIEGSRLLVPYVPALSILCAGVIAGVCKEKHLFGVYFYRLLIGLVLFTGLITAGYRLVANSKYIPVIIGTQSKQEFLIKNLNFSFGDFYDVDGYFAKNISQNDRVLLFGFHNLYYIDFPYIHSSWLNEGDSFNYIAIQDAELPEQYTSWKLIYENEITHVKLFKESKK